MTTIYHHEYSNKKMRKETEYSASFTHHFSDNLHCQCIEDGIIVPQWGDGIAYKGDSGGVRTKEGYQVLSSVFIGGEYKVRNLPETPIAERNEDVIYIGTFMAVYGHMITDGLKHLWFLHTDEGQKLIKSGIKLVYTTIFQVKLPQWALKILELAGVEINQIEQIEKTTQFSKVYVPDPSIIATQLNERFFNSSYISVINYIKRHIDTNNNYEKVYFSRTCLGKVGNKDAYGEKGIEKIFADNGYRIIYPEKLTIEEQISILKGCKVFAATEGSISHNAIFCEAGTKHIILRKTDFLNSYQMMINEAANLEVTYIDSNKSIMVPKDTPWAGPFYLYVSPNLRRFFNIHKISLPYYIKWSFMSYVLSNSYVTHKLSNIAKRIKSKLS